MLLRQLTGLRACQGTPLRSGRRADQPRHNFVFLGLGQLAVPNAEKQAVLVAQKEAWGNADRHCRPRSRDKDSWFKPLRCQVLLNVDISWRRGHGELNRRAVLSSGRNQSSVKGHTLLAIGTIPLKHEDERELSS